MADPTSTPALTFGSECMHCNAKIETKKQLKRAVKMGKWVKCELNIDYCSKLCRSEALSVERKIRDAAKAEAALGGTIVGPCRMCGTACVENVSLRVVDQENDANSFSLCRPRCLHLYRDFFPIESSEKLDDYSPAAIERRMQQLREMHAQLSQECPTAAKTMRDAFTARAQGGDDVVAPRMLALLDEVASSSSSSHASASSSKS